MQAWLKFFTSVCMLLFFTLFLDAKEPQGYKIVLVSFATFEEAKEALSHVEEKLSNQERSLQKTEKFEVVARPSGERFIVGLEPIESEEGTKRILKQFKSIYPDAYSSGYFGPTQGSIVLGSLSEKSVESNTTQQEIPIQKDQEITTPKELEPAVAESNDSNHMFYLFMAIGLAVILGGAYYARKIIGPYIDKIQEKKKPQETQEEYDRVTMVQEIGNALEDEAHHIEERYDADDLLNRDIFYRFKKNLFFAQYLRDLKEASDDKNSDTCFLLMKEILRYQQHFHISPMIQKLRILVEKQSFDELSKVLELEIK